MEGGDRAGFSGPDPTIGANVCRSAGATDLATLPALQLDVTVTFCIGESLNAALLQSELEEARGEDHALIRELLRDGVRHAQWGWRFLAAQARAGAVKHLEKPIADAVASAVRRRGAPAAAATMRHDKRTRLLDAALHELILSGLAAYASTPRYA